MDDAHRAVGENKTLHEGQFDPWSERDRKRRGELDDDHLCLELEAKIRLPALQLAIIVTAERKVATDSLPTRRFVELVLHRILSSKSTLEPYGTEDAKCLNVGLPAWFYVMGWSAKCSKSGMKGESKFTKLGIGTPTFIRFDSRLAPLTNAILQRRYGENSTVKEVLAWFAVQNVGCSRQTYQKFIRRLLFHLPDAQATTMGIELPMLHAVRRRLRLPLNGCKILKAPYARGRRSRL